MITQRSEQNFFNLEESQGFCSGFKKTAVNKSLFGVATGYCCDVTVHVDRLCREFTADVDSQTQEEEEENFPQKREVIRITIGSQAHLQASNMFSSARLTR